MRLRAALIAVALALASTASAQNLRSLVRATSTTGGNDSTLTLASDSAFRTRAMSLAQFRKALSVKAFDSLLTTALNLTGGTITGAPTWSSLQTFATGQRVDSATGTARAQKLTTARTIAATGDVTYTSPSFDGSGNVTATATVNAAPAGALTGATLAAGVTNSSLTSFGTNARTDSATGAARSQTLTTARALWGQNFDGSAALTAALTGANGSAAAPQYSYTNSTGLGAYRFGTDTLGWATLGVHSLRLSGGTSATLAGGAGNMTIIAGTGNNRTLTLKTTDANAGGTAITAVRFNEAQQALFTAGSSARPGISFAADTTTGLSQGASVINEVVSGTQIRSSSVALTSYPINAYQLILGTSTASSPSIQVGSGGGGNARGVYSVGQDTLGFAVAGVKALQLSGGAAVTIGGGAGNMTLTAGTGNSRTLTLQTTTSAGTAKNTLVLGADTSATFLGAGTFGGALSGITSLLTSDTITMRTSVSQRYITATQTGTGLVGFRVNRTGGTASDWLMYSDVALTTLKFYANSADRIVFGTDGTITPATDNASDLGSALKRWSELYLNPAASGVGDTYICLSTGQQVHSGATCAASTLKMKDSVVAYTNADAVLKLRPVTFNFKAGYYEQRAEIGLIAEEAALVDPRFVFVATKFDTLSKIAPTITLNALTQKLDTTAVVIKPGEPEALNISSIVAALVAQVQVQKRQLDSLSSVVFTLQAKLP